MIFDQENIKKILFENGYLEKSDIEYAEKSAKEAKKDFVSFLIESGLISRDLFGQAIAESLKLSYLDLNSNPPSNDLILKIPEEIAKKYRVVIFRKLSNGVILATDQPDSKELKKNGATVLKKLLNVKKIEFGFSLPEDINEIFLSYRHSLETRFSEMFSKGEIVISELLSGIVSDAISFRSSDIHFEPQGEKAVIRFRIDGILHEAGNIPRNYYENILNRIKVLSNMRIDEHLNPQDGAIRFELNNNFVDLRVSIIPTVEGEKAAIRILSVYVKNFSLSEVGMSPKNRKIFEEASRRPFGMILIVGPTGSGKSTTLYALLKELNSGKVNITTIEDPVEYKIAGIN
ncbi:MAG: ATPase, T2SS/T4P/T4SS family, partial [Candidatus Pacebacteria bacterium]|nr:ATPase, T2SS/T4P/T4SS family [Candidatus Paceibacterota bacterium]